MMASGPGKWFREPYRLDDEVRFFIWRSADEGEDAVFLDAAGRMPVFASVEALDVFAARHGVQLEDRMGEEEYLATPMDLDPIARWLDNPGPEAVDCKSFLNGWNLFDDVAFAVEEPFELDRDANLGIYDKLFWGNNIEPMTPPGEHYEPTWDAEEIAQLSDVLGSGLRLFRQVVALQT